jgi:type I restriction-modification system DNA methylase subunit
MRTKKRYLDDYITATHLTDKERKEKGAFYTPPEIALEMAEKTQYKSGETILDPCVGGGNLLAAMMDTYKELQEEDLYGIDIDPEAIKICRELFPYGHFQVGDCLEDDLTNDEFWNESENL